MNFNITYDSSVTAEAQAVIQSVAQFFDNHFADNVTINITASLGDLGPNGLGRSNWSFNSFSYSAIQSALSGDATTADDAAALANAVPSTDPISGTHTYWMVRAEQKALGLLSGTDTGSDGSVTFSNAPNTFDFNRADGITSGLYDFAGTVAHELTEVMGRSLNVGGTVTDSGGTAHPNSNFLFDLFHYSGDGTRSFSGSTAGYFSLDNGTTDLNDFNTISGGDAGDWGGTTLVGNDSFLAFSNSGVVNAVMNTDFRVMDVLGWDLVDQTPTIAPLVASVSEDGPTLSQDLLSGSADADDDFLVVQNLDGAVTTAGGRHLTLGTDYTFSGSTIALTAAGFAQFNNLAQGASDTIVFGYDITDFLQPVHNTFTVTVNGANDPPVANPDVGSAGENEIKSFDVVANDTDVDVGDTLSLLSLGSVTVSSSNPVINGLVLPSSVFTIVGGEIRFDPGSSFDPLSFTDTATVVVDYTMQDNHSATASSDLTLTVHGENDPPVIVSGGGGDSASYFVRVNEQSITTVVSTDVDVGDIDTFSIVGGADAGRFNIDPNTGELVFSSHPNPPNRSYTVQVQASDGHGGVDQQTITVNVSADKMNGDAAHAIDETFVFHPKFGANTVTNFDLNNDFLQFDSGMFAADTSAAVLAAAHDERGGLGIDVHAGHLTITGITKADLAAHVSDILFV